MACDKMGILISRVVDGEASEDDQRRLAEHVRSCAPCREEWDLFQANEDLVEESLSTRAFADDVVQGVLPRVGGAPDRAEAAAGPRARGSGWSDAGRTLLRLSWSPGAVAAAVLIPFAAFFMYQTLELQRTLLSISTTRPPAPTLDPAVVQEYRDVARHYQALTERLLESLGRERRPESPVAALPAPEVGSPPAREEGEPIQETIVVEKPQERVAGTGEVQVFAAVVDEGIQVVWDVASGVKPTEFRLYRRAAGEPEFAEPIVFKPGDPYFLDRNLKPKTKYVYKVEAVTPAGAPTVSSPEVVLETPGDLKLHFIGIGVATGTQPEEARLRVSKWVDDGWQHMTFVVRAGEPIGRKTLVTDIAKEVDFTTGWTLGRVTVESRTRYTQEKREYQFDAEGRPRVDPETGKPVYQTLQQKWVQREPRIELVDGNTKKRGLWLGEAAVGIRGSLED